MSYLIMKTNYVPWYVVRARTSSCSLYNRKKYAWLQYKPQIQAPGTTFSIFSDEVRLDGGRGNCCRLATFTGVHQGTHIWLAKLYGPKGKFGARAESQHVRQEKMRGTVEVVPVVDLIADSGKKKNMWAVQHR